MFLASILYLPLLMAAMVADRPARRPTPVGPPPKPARHSLKGLVNRASGWHALSLGEGRGCGAKKGGVSLSPKRTAHVPGSD